MKEKSGCFGMFIYLLLCVPLGLAAAFAGEILLTKPDVFSLTFTNISFALFLGLANVCFSWARSLEASRHEYSIRLINRIGFLSIFTAIFFIISSFLQYNLLFAFPKELMGMEHYAYFVTAWTKYLVIGIALLMVAIILYGIFKVGGRLLWYEYLLIYEFDDEFDSRNRAIPIKTEEEDDDEERE